MFYTYSSDSLPCRLLEYIFALMGENYTGRIVRPINRHLSSNFQKIRCFWGVLSYHEILSVHKVVIETGKASPS
jgi:hypothetical protein